MESNDISILMCMYECESRVRRTLSTEYPHGTIGVHYDHILCPPDAARAATPPPVIRPHRDVVGGRVGAAEHRVTESGGLVMRPVAALRTEEDNEFSTFF